MEERVLFVADVHEHRLEALFDVAHAAFENAADDIAVSRAFHVVFLEHAVLHERDTLLEFFDGDDEFVASLAGSESDESFHFIDEGECGLSEFV